jgi:hypothetical protein
VAFHEGVFQSVFHARDRYLKPGGIMIPSRITLFCAPVEDKVTWAAQVGTWQLNLHGIDMSCLVPDAVRSAFGHPWARCLAPEAVLAPGVPIGSFDLRMIPRAAFKLGDSLVDRATFEFTNIVRGDEPRQLHGFALWFDCQLTSTETGEGHVVLGTGPSGDVPRGENIRYFGGKSTNHWGQTMFYTSVPARLDAGDSLGGTITIQPHTPALSRKRRRGDSDSSAFDWRFLSVTIDSVVQPGAGDARSVERIALDTTQIEYAPEPP